MQALSKLRLLPHPRQISDATGQIRLDPALCARLAGPIANIRSGLSQLQVIGEERIAPQGYRLALTPTGIVIHARDDAGTFYALMTLRQIAGQCAEECPCGVIEDSPDYPTRGVMLDISRDKVPTLATLRMIVDELAAWKVNHLELYTEHTFAYARHKVVWHDASPLTADEIRQLDHWCRERCIELVPNQNSFGHFERWLKHPAYRSLAYDPQAPTCLDPRNPASLKLVAELYDELLPTFSSKKFNVGCDETQVHGDLYLEFLLSIHDEVKQRGHVMHFWDDIVIHHPEMIQRLPRDLVALEWGYEASHPFDERGALLVEAGLPFYVCPGTSSWNSFAGRTDTCLANIRNAAVNGHKHGAQGLLNTDWGDNGHWQYWPASYPGLAAGAAMAWCITTNADSDMAATLNTHVFGDSSGTIGQVMLDLGRADQPSGCPLPNSTIVFRWLRDATDSLMFEAVTRDQIEAVREAIRTAIRPLDRCQLNRPDAGLIRDELANTARMMDLACTRALKVKDPESISTREFDCELQEIVEEHRRLWLERNRIGGLEDSVRRLESCRSG